MNDRARIADAAGIAASVVRPEVRALKPYAVAKADGFVKLDAMENPYPLPDTVAMRLAGALAKVPINRYPDGGGDAVKRALTKTLSLASPDMLLLGNGSDELIQVIASTLARPGAVMLAPEPSFVMYRLSALNAGMRFVPVTLRPNFTLDMPALQQAIERERPAVVFLACPNNPTGNMFAAADIENVLRAAPGLVVVDEAYYAFADSSFLSRIDEFPNLLVLRTLSKVGMAGIRLGYAVSQPAWVAEFNKLRQPYNVNALTQAAVEALLEDTGWIDDQARAIRSERAGLESALAAMDGVTVYPSQANFVLARVADAGRVFETLKAKRILIKNLNEWHPLLKNCVRITVGTPDENRVLLSAINDLSRSS
jgi:histidinol-phosphate aminotransferase